MCLNMYCLSDGLSTGNPEIILAHTSGIISMFSGGRECDQVQIAFCPEVMVLQTTENVILSSPLCCLILDLNFDVN